MMKAAYRVGDMIMLSDEARENECYREFFHTILRVTHVSRSKEDHQGFDPSAGSPLYDFEPAYVNDKRVVPFSLYEWEMEPA